MGRQTRKKYSNLLTQGFGQTNFNKLGTHLVKKPWDMFIFSCIQSLDWRKDCWMCRIDFCNETIDKSFWKYGARQWENWFAQITGTYTTFALVYL